MPDSTRVLLDKNVARKMVRALAKNVQGIALNADERIALDLLFSFARNGKRVFIVSATANIFKKWFDDVEEVNDLRDRVEIIVSARYWRRWARRLQAFGFTREDARVLSLGTFGTDKANSFLGVDQVLTFDKPLVSLFEEKQEGIQEKLEAMTKVTSVKRDLESPYDDAQLPEVKLLGEQMGRKKHW